MLGWCVTEHGQEPGSFPWSLQLIGLSVNEWASVPSEASKEEQTRKKYGIWNVQHPEGAGTTWFFKVSEMNSGWMVSGHSCLIQNLAAERQGRAEEQIKTGLKPGHGGTHL